MLCIMLYFLMYCVKNKINFELILYGIICIFIVYTVSCAEIDNCEEISVVNYYCSER